MSGADLSPIKPHSDDSTSSDVFCVSSPRNVST